MKALQLQFSDDHVPKHVTLHLLLLRDCCCASQVWILLVAQWIMFAPTITLTGIGEEVCPCIPTATDIMEWYMGPAQCLEDMQRMAMLRRHVWRCRSPAWHATSSSSLCGAVSGSCLTPARGTALHVCLAST